jgi:excisionase family DNA binding protein
MSELYTVSEVCQKLKIARQTLDTWRKKGVLKSIKIGGKVYIKEDEIIKLLKENEEK